MDIENHAPVNIIMLNGNNQLLLQSVCLQYVFFYIFFYIFPRSGMDILKLL